VQWLNGEEAHKNQPSSRPQDCKTARLFISLQPE
jgi:hypothetical protein